MSAEGQTPHSLTEPAALTARALAALEIVSVISSALIAEWFVLSLTGVGSLLLAVPVGLAFVLMLASHRAWGERARDLGWRLDNFWPALRLLLWPMLGGSLLLWLGGHFWLGGDLVIGRQRAGWSLLGLPVWGLLWGLVQQYALQAYINRRAQVVWGRGWRSVLLVAALFALLHLPNPLLMGVTFLGGLGWAAVYQRTPNLWALAVSHSVMTWVLVSTVPGWALEGLRVGYKYFG